MGTAPRTMIRDRDGVHGKAARERLAGMGIPDVLTAPRSSWQSPYVERVIGCAAAPEALAGANVPTLSSSRTNAIFGGSWHPTWTIIIAPDVTCRSTRMRPTDGPCSRSAVARSRRFRKSADFITATSASQPEPALAHGHGYC